MAQTILEECSNYLCSPQVLYTEHDLLTLTFFLLFPPLPQSTGPQDRWVVMIVTWVSSHLNAGSLIYTRATKKISRGGLQETNYYFFFVFVGRPEEQDDSENSTIYITGLTEKVNLEEMAEFFKHVGPIRVRDASHWQLKAAKTCREIM